MSVTGLSRVGSSVGAGPAAITDQLTIERVSVPRVAAPGSPVPVQVTISCQATPFTNCEAALRVTTPSEERRVPQGGTRDISEGTSHTFSVSVSMSQGNMPVTIEALEAGPTGAFNVEASTERTVQAATQAEAAVINWGPWLVGGGTIGAGAAYFMNESPLVGAGLGAGVGAGARVGIRQFPSIDLPSIGLIELTGAAIVGGLGLILLRTFSEAEGGVGEVAGRAAGTAASAATGGASRIAGAVGSR